MVSGYVRKCVKLRIPSGLRSVALAAGEQPVIHSIPQVISITSTIIYDVLNEKIGPPLIIISSFFCITSTLLEDMISMLVHKTKSGGGTLTTHSKLTRNQI